MDDGRVKYHRVEVGTAVSNQAIAQRGFSEVHHFGVEDDGLLSHLAVCSMYAYVIPIVCAGAACIDGVSDQIAGCIGSVDIHRQKERHSVFGIGGRVAIEVFWVVHVARNGDFRGAVPI